MKTPNTIEGAIVEDIMERLSKKIRDIPVPIYNAVYEAALESLTFNMRMARVAPSEMDGEEFAATQRIMGICE